ncbi:MAG: SDR family oxidoreductase [Pseudomonadota bacterium]
MQGSLFDMSEQTVLVTGGGTGLGRRFAETLATAGAAVIIAGRRLEKLEETAQTLRDGGATVHTLVMDVSDRDSILTAMQDNPVVGSASVLVNNAGAVAGGMLLDLAEADWDSVMDTNLKGAWMVAAEFAKSLKDHGRAGAIVNIASVLGSSVQLGTGAYCPSKAALIQLTRLMSLEWARHGIRVNTIAPGYYRTDISEEYLESEAGAALVKKIPLRRLGEAQELDGAILLLASDASRYMTGSLITVDGGLSLAVV